METRVYLVEDFVKEVADELRYVLPAHVKDIRVTPKSVYVGLHEGRGAERTSRSFSADNRGYWHLQAIDWSPEGRCVTESGRLYAYTPTNPEWIARKAADWFSRDFAELVAQ